MKEPRLVINPGEAPVYEAPPSLPRKACVLIDRETAGAKGIAAGLFILGPGHHSMLDVHPDLEEIYYYIRGKGRLEMGGETYDVEAGTSVYIPPGMEHQSFNTGDEDLVLFWVFTPHPQGEYRHITEHWKQVGGE